MSVTCDPHGCCTLNGVLVVCSSPSDHVLAVGGVAGVLRKEEGGRGGGEVRMEWCRLTAAWVRYQSGCNLISFLVVCTIPVRFSYLVRILALFPFPPFLSCTIQARTWISVYIRPVCINALGLRESPSRLGLQKCPLSLGRTDASLVCLCLLSYTLI